MYRLIGLQEHSEIIIGVLKTSLVLVYLGKLNQQRTSIQGKYMKIIGIDEVDEDINNWESFSLMMK